MFMKTELKRKVVKGVIISVIIIAIFFIIFLSVQSCQTNKRLAEILEIQNKLDKKEFEFIKTLQDFNINTISTVIEDIEILKQGYNTNYEEIEGIKDDMDKIYADGKEQYEVNKGRIDKIWKALFE